MIHWLQSEDTVVLQEEPVTGVDCSELSSTHGGVIRVVFADESSAIHATQEWGPGSLLVGNKAMGWVAEESVKHSAPGNQSQRVGW